MVFQCSSLFSLHFVNRLDFTSAFLGSGAFLSASLSSLRPGISYCSNCKFLPRSPFCCHSFLPDVPYPTVLQSLTTISPDLVGYVALVASSWFRGRRQGSWPCITCIHKRIVSVMRNEETDDTFAVRIVNPRLKVKARFQRDPMGERQ